jgi:hypothetical protein
VRRLCGFFAALLALLPSQLFAHDQHMYSFNILNIDYDKVH